MILAGRIETTTKQKDYCYLLVSIRASPTQPTEYVG
jgi:hypothetical protein